jgi:hypothetical protein
MMERPVAQLKTLTTTSTTYVDVINYAISADAKGVCRFILSIDPDPNALYKIQVARVMNIQETEITAVWVLEFPHLTSGVYFQFAPGDMIQVQHRVNPNAVVGTQIKTGASMSLSEVVGGCYEWRM